MIQISLLDFLKTGQFGNVRLGMSRQEVLDILGAPWSWFPHKVRDFMLADTWDYYWVSFNFTPQHIEFLPEGLYSISMSRFYNIHGIEVTPHYTLDTWALSHQQEVDFVVERLKDAGLSYTQHNHLDKVIKHISIELASGFELSFHQNYDIEEHPEHFYFTSMGISRPTTKKNPTKQVSITIPRPLYDKLQRLSQKHSESISSICSDLLVPIVSRIPDAEDA